MTFTEPALRTQPRQQRALLTVARIKTAALELITEAGVEKFTTNHVAERVGLRFDVFRNGVRVRDGRGSFR